MLPTSVGVGSGTWITSCFDFLPQSNFWSNNSPVLGKCGASRCSGMEVLALINRFHAKSVSGLGSNQISDLEMGAFPTARDLLLAISYMQTKTRRRNRVSDLLHLNFLRTNLRASTVFQAVEGFHYLSLNSS